MANVDDFVRLFKASTSEDRARYIEDLKTKLTRTRSAQTRSISGAKKWLDKAATLPTDIAVAELKECMSKIKEHIKHLSYLTACYTSIPSNKDNDAYENDFVTREQSADDMLIACSEKIAHVQYLQFQKEKDASRPSSAAASHSAATPAPQNSRPVLDLKPEQLEYSATPTFFNNWQKNFKHYFQASKFNLEASDVQQGYLFACLGDTVRTELESRITEQTPIFAREGTSSCFSTLRSLWLQRHPVFVRRARLFTTKQQAGETATQLLDRLMEMARDAEIERMSLEDWVVQFALTSITDKRISTKWLEAGEPDITRLRELALSVETARAKTHKGGQADSSQSSAQVFASTSGQSHTSRSAAGSSSSKKEKSKAKGGPSPCYNCGSTKHAKKEDCPVFKKGVKCTGCQKAGHLQRVCRQNAKKPKNEAASQK